NAFRPWQLSKRRDWTAAAVSGCQGSLDLVSPERLWTRSLLDHLKQSDQPFHLWTDSSSLYSYGRSDRKQCAVSFHFQPGVNHWIDTHYTCPQLCRRCNVGQRKS